MKRVEKSLLMQQLNEYVLPRHLESDQQTGSIKTDRGASKGEDHLT